jgi:hypothetical protein
MAVGLRNGTLPALELKALDYQVAGRSKLAGLFPF